MNEALIVLTNPPYGRVLAVESFRMASGLKAMEINAALILVGEAIFALVKNQDGSRIHMPPMNAALDILAMSETPIAIVQEDMDILGFKKEDLLEYPYLEIINREELESRIASAKCSFRF